MPERIIYLDGETQPATAVAMPSLWVDSRMAHVRENTTMGLIPYRETFVEAGFTEDEIKRLEQEAAIQIQWQQFLSDPPAFRYPSRASNPQPR